MAQACRTVERPLGLFPTMGYLHGGHLALVRQARAENATVAVSIFVNPTQFGPCEDFDDYPRDRERDLALLEKEGVDLVFAPSTAELYPTSADTWVEARRLSQGLEGRYRHGHFTGVATVVAKLFNITRPNRAYFGQKDGQQAAIVKAMARDLNMQVNIVVAPTVRDSDGLALSSRNVRLSVKERPAAAVIYRSLQQRRDALAARRTQRRCPTGRGSANVGRRTTGVKGGLRQRRAPGNPAGVGNCNGSGHDIDGCLGGQNPAYRQPRIGP